MNRTLSANEKAYIEDIFKTGKTLNDRAKSKTPEKRADAMLKFNALLMFGAGLKAGSMIR